MNLDQSIVRLLKGEDINQIDDAFKYLFNKYSKLVYLCIVGIVKDTRDAEELTNDTFIRVFSNRKKLSQTRNIKYYIITIAKNLAIDFMKKKKVEIVLDEKIVNSSSSILPKPINVLKEELSMYVDLDDVEIIIYHVLYNYTFNTISKFLGKPVATIKTRYFRAVEKIHLAMERENEKV